MIFVAQVAKVDCEIAEPVDEARASCEYEEPPAVDAIERRFAPIPIRGPMAALPKDAEGKDCTAKLRDAAGKGFVLRCDANLFKGRSVTLPAVAAVEVAGKWGGMDVTPRAEDEGGIGKPNRLSVIAAVLLVLSALTSRDSFGDEFCEPEHSDLFLGSSICLF